MDILFKYYDFFKEKQIIQQRFSHQMVKSFLQNINSKLPEYQHIAAIKEVGKSYQGREIYIAKIGTGKTKLFFWSQMHGDESTATAALLDILNFFKADFHTSTFQHGSADEKTWFNNFRDVILKNCTLYLLPMLNPDGAELWQRRTAQEIDMNRDALALQTPEARLLKKLRTELQPDFGFNLHDQNIYYTAGNTKTCATISFLAPPTDYEKTINPQRKKAMQVIGLLAEKLQKFIPNGVAKFSDDFEPRAFGDNIQRWGTSTILVESGGYPQDSEKQFIRKLNFVLLLEACHSIATQAYNTMSLEKYNAIPQNEKLLKDLIIRNVAISPTLQADIAFMNMIPIESLGNAQQVYQATIDDIGDLSVFCGYTEINYTEQNIQLVGKIAVGEMVFLLSLSNQL
jgi:hypothetical protein